MMPSALSLLLSVAVQAQPAFLADGAPRAVRLVADDEPEPARRPSYAGWSRGQLRAEYQRLADLRPGIGMPIALMAVGGAGLAFSALVLLAGLSGGRVTNAAVPVLVVFSVVGVGGGALLIIGGVVLFRALPARRSYGEQLDAVDRLLQALPDDAREQPERPPERLQQYDEPPIIGPPPEGPPPLPLPPMPEASISFPLIFARF